MEQVDDVRQPLVSIGLPVYNGSQLLLPCLDSLLAQTYRNIEIIISDNASTDETVSICERYASTDSRIRFHRAERNRGAAWNHRRVLELARGEYFKWCGSDDAIEPRFVEQCVAALEARSDAALAYPLTIIIDEKGRPVQRTIDRLPLASPDVAVRFDALLDAWHITHSPFYGLIRRDALTRVRPFGDFLAGDRSFLAELSLVGPFVQVEEFLMLRRHYSKHHQRTVKGEQELLDPSAVEQFCPRELVMLREHSLSALRTARGPIDRLSLLGVVGRWALGNARVLAREAREYATLALRRPAPSRARTE